MEAVAKKKLNFYITFIVLVIAAAIARSGVITWTHSSLTHSMLQSVATVIAFFCGTAALYRYYKGEVKSNMMLFIGVGFLGTAVVDAYHTITTTVWFANAFPNVPSTVARWSWIATRMVLAILLFLSLLGMLWEKKGKTVNPIVTYVSVTVVTLAVLIFFMSVPIPFPVYPQYFISRPLELIPGFIFLITLIWYLAEGGWKTDDFKYWIVLCLIASVVCQFAYMGLSKQLFDNMYHSAHIIKIISYAMVYLGITSKVEAEKVKVTTKKTKSATS
jgi:hypothetical protein